MAIGDSVETHIEKTGYPSAALPTVFADGITNVAPGPQVVKFYLHRLAASLSGANDFLAQQILQIIMPTQSFLQMSIFFTDAIDDMVEKNLIPKETVEQARQEYAAAKAALREAQKTRPIVSPPST